MADIAPVQFYDPKLQQQAKRQRALAELLMKQGQQPTQTEMAGGLAVPQSPLAGFARALTQGLGGYQAGQAEQAENQIEANRQKLLAEAVGKLGTDNNAAAGILIQDPATMGEGFKLASEEAKAKRTADILAAKNESGVSGGATGALVQRLMDDTGMSFQDALYAVQTGMRQGTGLQDGKIVPTSGSLETKTLTKEAEGRGSARGKEIGEAEGGIGKKSIQAPQLNSLIEQAETLLPKATSGGGEEIINKTARFFGRSTDAAKADKALSVVAAGLTANVPRFEGPQSDRDTEQYRQAAGDVGNPALTIEERQSALAEVKRINNKYLGVQPVTPADVNGGGLKFLGFE